VGGHYSQAFKHHKVRIKMKRCVLRLITLTTIMAALPPICYAKTVLQAAVTSPALVDVLVFEPVPTTTEVISGFFGNNVELGAGISFLTGKSVVLNPLTGEDVIPCSNSKAGCTAQLININQDLESAINLSEKIMDGTVIENGKEISARIIVSVTVLYKSNTSNCSIYISGGAQYNVCINPEKECSKLLPSLASARYAASTDEVYRRDIRKICRQFNAWKKADCDYLKTKYNAPNLTNPVRILPTYSTRYKQYIWKTCKDVVPTLASWGSCPAGSPSECISPNVMP
jgi:hypothetical protein